MLCALFSCPIIAQDTAKVLAPTISLLTCSPGEEIWSEYGHTALRVRGLNGKDVVFNYGVFDSSQSNFILRFVFGLTDYRVDMMPFQYFLLEYQMQERGVTEQVLNLTKQEANNIVTALMENMLPENRVYRYNFFYDNCTTRPRDIILNNIEGSDIRIQSLQPASQTYRSQIHERNGRSPWNRYGEDLLLGIGADHEIMQEQAEFLPDILMHDFEHMTIDGEPFVVETKQLLRPLGHQEPVTAFGPFFWSAAWLMFSLLLMVIEWRTGKLFWIYDALLLLLAGCVGVVLTAMLFSQHPTVRINLLYSIYNLLPLVMLVRLIYNIVRARNRNCGISPLAVSWWKVWGLLAIIAIVGGFWQTYPEGTIFLALLLLSRSILNLLMIKRQRCNM